MEFREKLLSYRARDIMSADFKTVREHHRVNRVKEIMRLQSSGSLFILDDGGSLTGVFTMENLVRALMEGLMEEPVAKIMSREVVSVPEEADMLEILHQFRLRGFRSLPVVGNGNRPRGTITCREIINLFLEEMEGVSAGKKEEEGNEFRVSFPVESMDFQKLGEASTGIKDVLRDLGSLPPPLMRRIGVVAYEGECNIVIHSRGGEIGVIITSEEIRLIFRDEGPGIEDIEQALKPGFSTAPEQIKEMGFGAGMGLNNMQKMADGLNIDSKKGEGTIITATFNLHGRE